MRRALRTIREGLPGSVPSVLEASQEGTGRVHDNRADPGGETAHSPEPRSSPQFHQGHKGAKEMPAFSFQSTLPGESGPVASSNQRTNVLNHYTF